MWNDLWAALALVMVIEGILPFLNPRGYRQAMEQIFRMDDKGLRTMGLVSMLLGVALLYMVRS